MSDFDNVRANGKIAMKLDDGTRLIGVMPCATDDNVLLATRAGKCIRFPVSRLVTKLKDGVETTSELGVRVFAGRDSVGVRGIKLAKDDEVISLSLLRHVEATAEERAGYLRIANARRRAGAGEAGREHVSGAARATGEAGGAGTKRPTRVWQRRKTTRWGGGAARGWRKPAKARTQSACKRSC